jgi:hypothetical protein
MFRCECGGIFVYDGIAIDTTGAFMGFTYRCVKCGRRADE